MGCCSFAKPYHIVTPGSKPSYRVLPFPISGLDCTASCYLQQVKCKKSSNQVLPGMRLKLEMKIDVSKKSLAADIADKYSQIKG